MTRQEIVSDINDNFKLNPVFVQACLYAGVAPSKRQAAKYRNRKGQAFRFRFMAKREIAARERQLRRRAQQEARQAAAIAAAQAWR